MSPPSPVTRPLYRCLLRTARRFRSDPVLSSLLHRTGRTDGWDPSQGPYYRNPRVASSSSADDDDDFWGAGAGGQAGDITKEELRSIHLPPENARDLTMGYDELRRRHYRRTRGAARSSAAAASLPVGLGEGGGGAGGGDPILEIVPASRLEEYVMSKFNKHSERPAHEVLFRRLLRDVMGNGFAQMRFPSQIVERGDLGRLEDVVRREFRGPSLGKWDGGADRSAEVPVSSYFDDDARREAGFLALRELNKKISWAASLGGAESSSRSATKGRGEAALAATTDDRAAPLRREATEEEDSNAGDGAAADDEEERARRQWYRRQAARDVTPLPTSPPSSYLRSGSYLVAHPLMPGYFARTVIAILEHTEDTSGDEEDGDDDGASGDDGTQQQHTSNGGTYGLVVNRESLAPLPGGSGDRRRPRALREIIRPDTLPDPLRRAFGELPVRDGGPVNVAVQMLHAASPEAEERLRIGGTVLPMIPRDGGPSVVGSGGGGDCGNGAEEEKEEGKAASSTAMDTDTAVYYNGDLLKAAQAVLNGDMDRDDFSFVIGASVWSVHQLESEIERGFWLPCRGPPHMALTGMCEHVETTSDAEKKGSGKGKKCPSRPKSDLWLSMMCAIGGEEAKLAHLMLDEEYDENGEACDDF